MAAFGGLQVHPGRFPAMDLGSATWTDADAAGADLALLPVGSTEQHGPHAPLSTDTVLAEAVAAAGADAYDGEVVVAPPLPVGVSEEHRGFAGTLWLSPDAFRAAVRDVVESCLHNGWNRVVVVNGHGGNVDALHEVAAAVTRAEPAHVVPFTWFRSVDFEALVEGTDLDSLDMGHAGAAETAMLRATHPDLVREDRVEEAREAAADRWGEWVSGVNLAYDTDEFADNGVVGDPAAGDDEVGRALLDASAASLAALLGKVADREID